jgi:hypothetical protein
MVVNDMLLDRDLDAPELLAPRPPGIYACSECTIRIGPGYISREAFVHPSRPGVVCEMCYDSLERQAARRRATPRRVRH